MYQMEIASLKARMLYQSYSKKRPYLFSPNICHRPRSVDEIYKAITANMVEIGVIDKAKYNFLCFCDPFTFVEEDFTIVVMSFFSGDRIGLRPGFTEAFYSGYLYRFLNAWSINKGDGNYKVDRCYREFYSERIEEWFKHEFQGFILDRQLN